MRSQMKPKGFNYEVILPSGNQKPVSKNTFQMNQNQNRYGNIKENNEIFEYPQSNTTNSFYYPENKNSNQNDLRNKNFSNNQYEQQKQQRFSSQNTMKNQNYPQFINEYQSYSSERNFNNNINNFSSANNFQNNQQRNSINNKYIPPKIQLLENQPNAKVEIKYVKCFNFRCGALLQHTSEASQVICPFCSTIAIRKEFYTCGKCYSNLVFPYAMLQLKCTNCKAINLNPRTLSENKFTSYQN